MPTYTDSYLSPLATPYREDRAAAEVDALGAFPTTPVDCGLARPPYHPARVHRDLP
jgi:hypothetical protein